jgi:hypothetical protein
LLRNWTELLPLFVVRLLAQRCESIRVNGLVVRVPRPGVMIQVEDTGVEKRYTYEKFGGTLSAAVKALELEKGGKFA